MLQAAVSHARRVAARRALYLSATWWLNPSMLLTLKVKLAAPVLGGLKPDHGGVRRFERTNGLLLVRQFRFEESLQLAGRNLGLPNADAFVRMEHTCQPPTITLYDRRFRQNNILKQEMFEAFRKGSVISFRCMLRDDLEGCPRIEQIRELFSVAGEYVGMSPFGSKFGMGRFNVESLMSAGNETATCETMSVAAAGG